MSEFRYVLSLPFPEEKIALITTTSLCFALCALPDSQLPLYPPFLNEILEVCSWLCSGVFSGT